MDKVLYITWFEQRQVGRTSTGGNDDKVIIGEFHNKRFNVNVNEKYGIIEISGPF